MANRQLNSKSPTIRRILREASELSATPSPDYTATPLEDNLFEWHFTLRGPPGDESASTGAGAGGSASKMGPYHDGIYHGRIVLPPAYPLKPPSFRFMTPSGRFETNREICLSISGHHEETWQPAWGLRTALVALRSFMETDARGQLGGLECNDATRRRLAAESRAWTCPVCARPNADILQDSADAAAAQATDDNFSDRGRRLDEVPPELRMGWRDEMGQRAGAAADDDEMAALAEGFVQTAPPPAPAEAEAAPHLRARTTLAASAVGEGSYPAARPGQTVPQPTGASASASRAPATRRPRQMDRDSNEGVPAWVDRAIAGLIFSLVIMLLRALFGR